ncbi:MAG: SusD/RagB family nutrient-binding outer membrane lipoprotein [Tannerella sp.]|jgi:hypothetical protein|nr:SusD/RagB family nutrient-binding outer membrane lipoprotein [Tannerella sp.]
MKRFIYFFTIVGFVAYFTSCTGNFAEINTNPQIMTDPKVEYLFTYAEDALPDGGSAWLYETLEQYLRWSQLVTTESYEAGSMDMHSRYNNLYRAVLPNLFEVRRLIEAMPDKDAYMKMWAASYVIQVYATLRVTDVFGSIPYTEAIHARTENKYDPAYDSQQVLFERFYEELTEANRILQDQSLPQQAFASSADIYYNGDWTKWSRLANALLLRLASRYEGQDKNKTITIFKQVMQDPVGVMTSNNDQFVYIRPETNVFGNDINYRSARYASRNVVKFMKATGDPRISMYYEPNGLTEGFRDSLAKYGVTPPDFIDIDDPLVQYQGGPVNWTDPDSKWIKGTLDVSNATKYALVSSINRKFFSTKMNGATDVFTDVLVSYAEVCFYIAEFIEKGYGSGADTKGSAEDWYKKGVEASIRSMYDISQRAASSSAISDENLAQIIAAYQQANGVKLNGSDDLEKILIQEYINFFRSGNEAYAFARRTGYPKQTSTILPGEVLSESIPRRLWTQEPMELNRAHWEESIREQGFSLRDYTMATLSAERLWWDKNNPAYGKGE